MTEYIIEVRNANLERVGQLTGRDHLNTLITPRLNEVGVWQVQLPATIRNSQGVRVPHRLCEELKQPGSGIIVSVAGGETIFSGNRETRKLEVTAKNPYGIWNFTGTSDLVHLQDALAWPNPASIDPMGQGRANDVQKMAAESLMHYFVNSNIGPASPAMRRINEIVMGPDLGRGPIVEKSPRWQNMLELFQEIVAGTMLRFDIRQIGDELVFVTEESVDRTDTIRMDVRNNQLKAAELVEQAPSLTRVVGASDGEGDDRTVIFRQSPESIVSEQIWRRKIERFRDRRDTKGTDQLIQTVDEMLAEEAASRGGVEFTPNDSRNMRLHEDWFLGDLISATIQGDEFESRVVSTPIYVSNGKSIAGATLGAEGIYSTSDSSGLVLRNVSSRLSQIERNVEASPALPDPPAKDLVLGSDKDLKPVWVAPGGPVRLLTDLDNLNAVTNQGFYECNNNGFASKTNNYPIARSGFLEVIYSNNRILQRYTAESGVVPIEFNRYWWNGTWGSWTVLGGTIYQTNTTVMNAVHFPYTGLKALFHDGYTCYDWTGTRWRLLTNTWQNVLRRAGYTVHSSQIPQMRLKDGMLQARGAIAKQSGSFGVGYEEVGTVPAAVNDAFSDPGWATVSTLHGAGGHLSFRGYWDNSGTLRVYYSRASGSQDAGYFTLNGFSGKPIDD